MRFALRFAIILLLTKQDESIMKSSHNVHIISLIALAILTISAAFEIQAPYTTSNILDVCYPLFLFVAYIQINRLLKVLKDNNIDADKALDKQIENLFCGKG